jgi:hypothetical protein
MSFCTFSGINEWWHVLAGVSVLTAVLAVWGVALAKHVGGDHETGSRSRSGAGVWFALYAHGSHESASV